MFILGYLKARIGLPISVNWTFFTRWIRLRCYERK